VLAVLDRRRQKKSGKFPVKIEVVSRREQRYFPTGIDLRQDDWQRMQRSSRMMTEEKTMVADKFGRVLSEVSQLMAAGLFTLDALSKRMGKVHVSTMSESLKAEADRCLQEQRINSYYRYRTTAASIRSTSSDVPLRMVTEAWLREYERRLASTGKSPTTINIYMKTIKSALAKAVDDGHIARHDFPFGKGRYQPPHASRRRIALTMPQIQRLMDYKGSQRLEKWRDMWLFSYLCNGINFKDMLFLRWGDATDGEICFVRSKTAKAYGDGKVIRAVLTDKMQDIISRWGNERDGDPDTLLFKEAEGIGEMEKVKAVRKAVSKCNAALRQLSKELGLPHFTTYAARHSFATILQKAGASVSFIQQSLGHSSVTVTESYLEGFDREDRERNARLLTPC